MIYFSLLLFFCLFSMPEIKRDSLVGLSEAKEVLETLVGRALRAARAPPSASSLLGQIPSSGKQHSHSNAIRKMPLYHANSPREAENHLALGF